MESIQQLEKYIAKYRAEMPNPKERPWFAEMEEWIKQPRELWVPGQD